MPEVRFGDISVGSPPTGFWQLLSQSVGGATAKKLERVRLSYAVPERGLMAAWVGQHLTGVIGDHRTETELEITHIAVSEEFRRHGVARALIAPVMHGHSGLEAIAETDDEAVGFYVAMGWQAEALPREIGRAQRWRCRLAAPRHCTA